MDGRNRCRNHHRINVFSSSDLKHLVFAVLISLVILVGIVERTNAHGRLEEPAARNCAWRFGYKTPENYNDNELNCGGVGQQWTTNGGKCGICGDPFHGIRNHEAGGKYATGTIVRTYNIGQIIDITVRLSANHLGTMEFRLCPVDQSFEEASQECLNQNILQIIGHGTGYPVKAHENLIHLQVKLPDDLTCTHCVLQWKYRAGNNWGSLPNGRSGLGVGPQEEFYNCADVAIRREGDANINNMDDYGSHVTFELLPTPKPVKPNRIPTRTKATTTTTTPTTTTVEEEYESSTSQFDDYESLSSSSSSSSTSTSTSTSTSSTSTEPNLLESSSLSPVEIDSLDGDEEPSPMHYQQQQQQQQSEQDEELDSITPPAIHHRPIEDQQLEEQQNRKKQEQEQKRHDAEQEKGGEQQEEENTVSAETPIPIPVFSQLLQLLLNGNPTITASSSGELPSGSSSESVASPSSNSQSSSSFFHCERLPLSLVPFIESTPDPNEYKGIPLCLLIGDDSETSCKDCYERCITPLKECPRQYCYCKWYV